MQNDSCFLKKINFLVLFCVILLHGFNAFPQSEKNKTKIEKNSFEQKIQWEQDENASEYKVEIRDVKSGKKYYFETEENFVNLNLPASRYEYQVTVLNSFGRVQTASGWNSFEIFKAELPEIVKVQKKSVVPSKDDDFFIETDIKNVNEDSAVSLVNEKTGKTIKGSLVMQKSAGKNEKTATKVKFPKVENGEWKLIVENPLGQKTESASIQVVDQKTEEVRIAAEKAERERLAKAEEEKRLAEEARIAEEKRLAEEAEAARALELARAEEERQLAQKQEEERRKAEEARIAAEKAEQERLARAEEEKRLAEEARIAEEKRLAEEAEAARALELARAEEERQLAQKQEEERRKAEEARIAAEKAEQERLARAEEEKRLAEEARIAEEKRLAEEAEAARALELARAEEERQLAQKQEEERRKAEEARIAAEKAEQERLARAEEEKRLAEEARIAEEKRLEEEKIASEPETKKSGKKEKRILGFYAAADGGLLFSPFFDEFSDGKAMPFLGLKLGFVPEIKKSNRIGVEIDSLVSKYELNTSNYDYSDKFAFLRMNLLYQRKIFRNALKLNVRAGGNLIFIQNFMDYKDSDNLKKDAAYGYLGVQGGSSFVFTAGNFLMEAGADYIFVFIDGMPTDFLSPYISLGIRW